MNCPYWTDRIPQRNTVLTAGVADLVDARDLKSRGACPVRVRFPPPAPRGELMRNLKNPFSCFFILFLISAGCESGNEDADAGADAAGAADAATGTDSDADIDAGADAGDSGVHDFWGPAPDVETRLMIFDEMWKTLGRAYPCFVTNKVDWDEVNAVYRPMVEAARGYGEFYGILSSIFFMLKDGHTLIWSDRVCGESPGSFDPAFNLDLTQRPPVYVLEDRISLIGACVTPTDDGELVVYRVDDDNPADLKPGDVITGYDGEDWMDLMIEVGEMNLPLCGRPASNDLSIEYKAMMSVMNNPHLFDELNFRRAGSDAIESVDTERLLDHASTLACNDQLPVDGVDFPCDNWDACFDTGLFASDDMTWGILKDTNIGYIYAYSWLVGMDQFFLDAVTALWDTDAIIIDQRFGVGGTVSWDQATQWLFDEPVDYVMQCSPRSSWDDYEAINRDTGWVIGIKADAGTYYDKPIALLQGPKMGSAGDIFPYSMQYHPMVRRFGRVTDGRFGAMAYFWAPDPFIQDLHMAFTSCIFIDEHGDFLQNTKQKPEQEVWLNADDVARGVDTVVGEALDWIQGGSTK